MTIFSKNEVFLKEFHAQLPGCTSQTMASQLTPENKSSYELLADLVPVGNKPLKVLDLACGDGYLLSLLESRNQQGLELHGIDMSEGELSAAKKRLGHSRGLEIGRVQELPFADASFDVVLCHMAFMLMDSVDEVVREISRVLKRAGIFSAIISGKRTDNPANQVFRELAVSTLEKQHLDFLSQIGDSRLKRTSTNEGIQSVFESSFSDPIQIKDFLLTAHETIDGATHFFMSYYLSALLEKSKKIEFENELRSRLTKLADSQGRVKCVECLTQIIAQLRN